MTHTENRLAVLSNARSRCNAGRRSALAYLDRVDGIAHRVTRDPAELPQALDELLATQPEALAVNGGDGTLQTVLTELHRRGGWERLPPLVVLPGGTTNMSARDITGCGSLRRALAQFFALRNRPSGTWQVETRPVLNVMTADGTVFCGLFFGIGAIVRGVEFWEEQLKRSRSVGEWGAGTALARGVVGVARRHAPFSIPTAVTLRVDDAPPSEQEILLLLITVMRRLFLRLRPFWGPGEGPLSVSWVETGPQRFVRRLPALLRGWEERLPTDEGYHGCRARRVVLDLEDAWLLDGVVQTTPGPLTLSASDPLPFVVLGGHQP